MNKAALMLGCSLMMLTACGASKSDRALTGGIIGAGAGAVIGATVGAPVTGASLGAAAGASVGVLTDKAHLDLGKPIWDR